ncbi:MAG: HAD family hydrolase [Elusimicrobia bacterium]|nr:HAD family hydrolase [Elusimicrobiota bacterium]
MSALTFSRSYAQALRRSAAPPLRRALKNRAIFLDRDGTIIHEAHYLRDPRKVKLYRGAAKALKQAERSGFKLIIVSNQSGIGRGWVCEKTVDRIHNKMKRLLSASSGARLDAVYFCPHAPWDHCPCRKPKPLLVRQACRRFNIDPRRSFVIGDKIADIKLAKAAGSTGVLVLTGHGREEWARWPKNKNWKPIYVAGSLFTAIRWIVGREKLVK